MSPVDIPQEPGRHAHQPNEWERAYLRFERPSEEIRKFERRLAALGAGLWPKESQIVELFCGRGNGLLALRNIGFTRVEGIDLSAALVRLYAGPGSVTVGDCRDLPYDDNSRDVLLVQGGLHHLSDLADLNRVVREAKRVLRPGGLFVVVEPWLTPFLRFAHLLCSLRIARRLSTKIDALATMIEHERATYDNWLSRPHEVEPLLTSQFDVVYRRIAWGKLALVARKRVSC